MGGVLNIERCAYKKFFEIGIHFLNFAYAIVWLHLKNYLKVAIPRFSIRIRMRIGKIFKCGRPIPRFSIRKTYLPVLTLL